MAKNGFLSKAAAITLALALMIALAPSGRTTAQSNDILQSVHLSAALDGPNEVPGPGDEDGLGESHVFINQETSSLCFFIMAEQITLPADAAHIHAAEEGVAGDVVVPLAPPDEMGNVAACVAEVDPALLQAILDDPAGYYVNVHTSDYPDGAIRGQLATE